MTKSKTVLWIDDDYNRYVDLTSSLQKEGFVFEFADSFIEARRKFETLERYDAILMDIILQKGEDYPIEESKEHASSNEYLGLTLLEDLYKSKEQIPKIVVLTIAEDPRVLRQISTMKERKHFISKVLRKGILKQQDVHDAICSALLTKV